jgi:hypothetical protein
MNGPKGTARLSKQSPGSYFFSINSYLDPGDYSITGGGTNDVGDFDVRLTIARGVDWTNGAAISTVSLTRDLTVTWTVGVQSSASVLITGKAGNTDNPLYVATFTCLAPVADGAFTIPAAVFRNFPPANGTLSVGTLSPSMRFPAAALDVGVVDYRIMTDASVTYR